jgi:putative ABC transport system permease protein
MRGLAWSQLKHRPTRLLALLVGLLVATCAFTVLTAAARTSELRTVGTVSAHFVPAYEILVRPRGARTSLETSTDTVQPNFLSGIYGGINMAQYHEIAQIPGVEVAAPIAMVGYALLSAPIMIPVEPVSYSKAGRELFRVSTTWTSEAGTSHSVQPPSYLYVTANSLEFDSTTGADNEELPGGTLVAVCPFLMPSQNENPFGVQAQSSAECWSKKDGQPAPFGSGSSHPYVAVTWVVPVLIAAIDPDEEAELDGLNKAITKGTYLTEGEGDTAVGGNTSTFPVLASSDVGMDETATTRVELLPQPQSAPNMNVEWLERETRPKGATVSSTTTTASQAYGTLLHDMDGHDGLSGDVSGYWSVSPVTYTRSATGTLSPTLVTNPNSDWFAGGYSDVSPDDADNQFRRVTPHTHYSNQYALSAGALATPRLVGEFDSGKIKSFDPLSQVPLGAYQPVVASPADSETEDALHGKNLLPNENIGGYVSQPVNLITTLSALSALQNSGHYGGDLHKSDPISVIRVKVAGVTGPNSVSLERIRQVAQQILERTHLDVDIVAGSSPTPTRVDLPPGKFGAPALSLNENWVKKGVAISILSAVDRSSVVLFLLILLVCILFVANSAWAAVRARRQELGILACLGWTRPRLFATVLSELMGIGLVAGILGALAALPLSAALGLHASVTHALLAVPIAVGVSVVAGIAPAWLAARAEPVASVRPAVTTVRRTHHPSGITGLAMVNVLRAPGRSLLAALSLAVGITALTVVTAVTFAFQGVVVGSLLGNAVALQVRGVDYVAVTATILLGILAVSDVIVLNIRERAPELATTRAMGWRELTMSRLLVTEGMIVGFCGSVAGAGIGLLLAAKLAGQLPERLYVIAGTEVIAGVLVTATAAVVPARMLRKLPAARLLSEE